MRTGIDGCKYSGSCPYSTKYLRNIQGSPVSGNTPWKKRGIYRYGRSTEKGPVRPVRPFNDKRAVDHQTVNLLFEDGITANLTMCAFSNFERETHIMWTMGDPRL